MLSRIPKKLYRLFPLSITQIIYSHMDKAALTLLDIGCGQGDTMQKIQRQGLYCVGIDIFVPYLKEVEGKGIYRDVIAANARFLPFKPKSFDIVLCTALIEHLEKKDGFRLLGHLENIARRQVIVATPMGYLRQAEYDSNPYQVHRSGWLPDEFQECGYNVIPTTLRFPMRAHGVQIFIRYLLTLLFYPLNHLRPQWFADLICIKNLHAKSPGSQRLEARK